MSKDIEKLNKSAYEYFLSNRRQYIDICKPLANFGISHFCYMKTFKDGSYFSTGLDNLGYVELYLTTVKDQGNIITNVLNQAASSNKNYYYLFPSDIKLYDRKKDPIAHYSYDFGIWNNFSIHRSNNFDFVESYYFFSDHDNDNQVTNFYLNKIPLLEQFIDYFKEKAADFTDTSDKRKLGYLEQQYVFNRKSEEDIITEKAKEFLQQARFKRISIIGKNQESIRLTTRETECLQYLALGNTTKEIANILELSPRTVESYLQNTKLKTGYTYRSQLVNNFLKSKNITWW